MVAQFDRGTAETSWFTPVPDASDSEGVRMALETARSLEAQGELRGAARWIGRAADEAENGGTEERVLMLARAAADLTNMIEFGPEAATAPHDIVSPLIRSSDDTESTLPSSVPAATPPAVSYVAELSRPADPTLTRHMRVMRVAIAGTVDSKSFSVERLESGESSPKGTIKGMLVLISASEAHDEEEPYVRFVAGAKTSA